MTRLLTPEDRKEWTQTLETHFAPTYGARVVDVICEHGPRRSVRDSEPETVLELFCAGVRAGCFGPIVAPGAQAAVAHERTALANHAFRVAAVLTLPPVHPVALRCLARMTYACFGALGWSLRERASLAKATADELSDELPVGPAPWALPTTDVDTKYATIEVVVEAGGEERVATALETALRGWAGLLGAGAFPSRGESFSRGGFEGMQNLFADEFTARFSPLSAGPLGWLALGSALKHVSDHICPIRQVKVRP